jgi:hypothetical protein
MAEAATKTPRKTSKPAPETSVPETETVNGFTLIHKGHGKYGIEGQTKEFPSRTEALGYIADLEAAKQYEEQFGDLLPEGFEVRHRTLIYRDNPLELPMNEQYLPDGGHSPYYDRTWYWGWGRVSGPDIAQKQAKGYRLVTREELEEAVEEGKVPDHYLNLLMSVELGARVVYADLALMRIPRVLWRQHQAAKEKAAVQRIERQDASNHEAFDRAGVKNISGPIQNEVSSGLKISGF